MLKMFRSSDLGSRLEQIRKQLGMTQGELCHLLNVSRTSLQLYVKGERDIPVSGLAALYEQYEIDPIWMMYGEEKNSLTSFEIGFFEKYDEIAEKLNQMLLARKIHLEDGIKRKLIRHVFGALKASHITEESRAETIDTTLETALELVA